MRNLGFFGATLALTAFLIMKVAGEFRAELMIMPNWQLFTGALLFLAFGWWKFAKTFSSREEMISSHSFLAFLIYGVPIAFTLVAGYFVHSKMNMDGSVNPGLFVMLFAYMTGMIWFCVPAGFISHSRSGKNKIKVNEPLNVRNTWLFYSSLAAIFGTVALIMYLGKWPYTTVSIADSLWFFLIMAALPLMGIQLAINPGLSAESPEKEFPVKRWIADQFLAGEIKTWLKNRKKPEAFLWLAGRFHLLEHIGQAEDEFPKSMLAHPGWKIRHLNSVRAGLQAMREAILSENVRFWDAPHHAWCTGCKARAKIVAQGKDEVVVCRICGKVDHLIPDVKEAVGVLHRPSDQMPVNGRLEVRLWINTRGQLIPAEPDWVELRPHPKHKFDWFISAWTEWTIAQRGNYAATNDIRIDDAVTLTENSRRLLREF